MPSPRPYQLEDAVKVRDRYVAGVHRQLLKHATGLGKTPFFCMLRDFMGFTGRVLVLVHRDELVRQAVEKIKEWNPGATVGVEKADEHADQETYVVASVQTIGRSGSPRLLKFNPSEFSLVVVDEGHHAMADSYRTVINHFTHNPSLLLLLVTATPNRADGKGLGEIVQEIVADRSILWGIRNGWLADIRGISIKTKTDLSNVSTTAGDFNQGQLAAAVNQGQRNRLVVDGWMKHAQDRQTVIFTAGVKHAQDLAAAFRGCAINAEAVWGDDPDRALKLELHRAGKIKVLLNDSLLTEGYDDWRIGCIGLAGSTQSEGKYTQMLGRGTRIDPATGNLVQARAAGLTIAKEDCIVLDYVDATSRHSLVTLPSLFGLNRQADMKGRKITVILDEVERIKAQVPDANLSLVQDLDKLESYAEHVDMFRVQFTPEILQFSEYQWHKTGDTAYVLLLRDDDAVTVITDLLDKWHVIGQVKDKELRIMNFDSLQEAIEEADYKVELFGGRMATRKAQRTTKTDDGPPTPAQRISAKQLGIAVPAGATFGQVRLAVNAALAVRRQQKIA